MTVSEFLFGSFVQAVDAAPRLPFFYRFAPPTVADVEVRFLPLLKEYPIDLPMPATLEIYNASHHSVLLNWGRTGPSWGPDLRFFLAKSDEISRGIQNSSLGDCEYNISYFPYRLRPGETLRHRMYLDHRLIFSTPTTGLTATWVLDLSPGQTMAGTMTFSVISPNDPWDDYFRQAQLDRDARDVIPEVEINWDATAP